MSQTQPGDKDHPIKRAKTLYPTLAEFQNFSAYVLEACDRYHGDFGMVKVDPPSFAYPARLYLPQIGRQKERLVTRI